MTYDDFIEIIKYSKINMKLINWPIWSLFLTQISELFAINIHLINNIFIQIILP